MKHLVIPDTQVKPGVRTDHLEALGHFIVEKRPNVIVHLGDHYDMPSLSSFDGAAKKSVERRDVAEDLHAGHQAFDRLMAPIKAYNRRQNAKRRYKPKLVYCLGNHENRINRLLEAEPWYAGLVQGWETHAQALGWTVVPFLQAVVIDGINYAHFFTLGPNGMPSKAGTRAGQPNAKQQCQRVGASATAGHKQGLDVHIQPMANRTIRGLIAGSFYDHDEAYLGPQGTRYWRGVLMKHEVKNGQYDLMEVSMEYLLREYL
jgi:hypothetical protein